MWWEILQDFVADVSLFPAVKNENRLSFDKGRADYKVGSFWDTVYFDRSASQNAANV